MKSKLCILLLSLVVSSCFTTRKTADVLGENSGERSLDTLCLNSKPYESLYINKVKATVTLDGETYDAKVSLYYIPDSVIFLTAANSGFEIIRAAITSDSTIFINRIDKVVYIYRERDLGYQAPVEFKDLEFLMNQGMVCKEMKALTETKDGIQLDFSGDYINKKIRYSPNDLKFNKFEFFHTKTSEYIVGEMTSSDTLSVFSNYIFEDIEIKATGGEIEYNREISVNISFNKNKYTILDQ
jgi:hypothetical protein